MTLAACAKAQSVRHLLAPQYLVEREERPEDTELLGSQRDARGIEGILGGFLKNLDLDGLNSLFRTRGAEDRR